ncbi:MAG: chromate transporter, partial [Anaerolineae bacterium]|nr:chromate transporter [Anaerolineae bacterium]
GALLDGVNAGALGLMAAVTLQVGASALVDWPSWTLGLVSLLVLLRTRVNPTWLIAAGALLGWILMKVG